MTTWTDPKPLSDYKGEKRMPGLYVIGRARDPAAPPLPSHADDPYLLDNWPTNFQPEYVGISGECPRRTWTAELPRAIKRQQAHRGTHWPKDSTLLHRHLWARCL